MDNNKIHRKINIRTLKNHTLMLKRNYYDGNILDGNCWDKFVCDLKIPKSNGNILSKYTWADFLCDKIPMKDDVDKYIIRFKNLIEIYHLVINVFYPSCQMYQMCKCGLKRIKHDFLKDCIPNDIIVTNNEVGEYEPGQFVVITSEKTIFDKYFASHNDYLCAFMSFMDSFINTNESLNIQQDVIPYFDINCYISSSSRDMGIMTPIMEMWIPNKKYYIGDTVIYNGANFELVKGGDYDKYELTGEILNTYLHDTRYVVITEEELDIYIKNILEPKATSKRYILKVTREPRSIEPTIITQYYLLVPFFTGYFNEKTKMVEFDKVDYFYIVDSYGNKIPMENLVQSDGYWKNKNLTDNTLYTDDHYQPLKNITSTQLKNFQRKKKSVDLNGNVLPFIVNSNGDVEFTYMIGVNNTYLNVDDMCYDRIDVINIYNNENDTTPIKSFNTSGVINMSEITDLWGKNDNNAKVIEFKYTICSKSPVLGSLLETGISYCERYYCNKKILECFYDKPTEKTTFIYVEVNDSKSLVKNDYISDSLKLREPAYSVQTIGENNKRLSSLTTHIFKNEALIGTQDIVSDVDIDIERGKSSAFEMHNILGEVRTMQDLTNYRNNFFKI